MASNSYYAKTYDEWKKKWGVDAGTKVEGMTDNDFALGLYLQGQDEQSKQADSAYNATQDSLFRQYQSGANSLNQAYNANLSQLDASKKTSEQNADILHQKMQKYLGTQADAAGMSGTGYASPESLKLRANAAYNQNLGNIAANYNANKTSLDTAKLSGLSDLENAYMTGEEQAAATRDATKAQIAANNTNKLLSMYSDEAAANKAEADKAEADIEDSYDTYAAKALSAINNEDISVEETYTYLDSIKDNLRAEDYTLLSAYAKAKENKAAKANEETSKSYQESAYDTAFNNAMAMIQYAGIDDAKAYIDNNKSSFRPDDYTRLVAYAEKAEKEASDATTAKGDAEKEAKLAQAYNDFITALNAGAFETSEEAMAWATQKGIADYASVNALAKTVNINNNKAATAKEEAEAAQAKAEKEQAQQNAYNYASAALAGATTGDEAYAILDSYKANLSDDAFKLLETQISQQLGPRGAMTLEKFKNGAAVGEYVYDGEVTNYMLNQTGNRKFGGRFEKALKDTYNTDDPYDETLKDGAVIEFDADNKGLFTGDTHYTLMYYGGQWYQVKKAPQINTGSLNPNYGYFSQYFEK